MDDGGRSLAGARAVGVRPSTVRADFEAFAGSLPSETDLGGLLAAVWRVESETMRWLLLDSSDARPGRNTQEGRRP